MPISSSIRNRLQRLGIDVTRNRARFELRLPSSINEREEAEDFLSDVIRNARRILAPSFTFDETQESVSAQNGNWQILFSANVIESSTPIDITEIPEVGTRVLSNPVFGLGVEHEMVLGGSNGKLWKIVSGSTIAGGRGFHRPYYASQGLIGPRYVAEVLGNSVAEKDRIEREIKDDQSQSYDGRITSEVNKRRIDKSGGITGYEETGSLSALGVGFGGDYKLAEIKTTKWKNAKVEDVAKDIIKKDKIVEKLVNQRANNLSSGGRIVKQVKQHATDEKAVIIPFGAVEGAIGGIGGGRGYTGSYHVNIMLPHDNRTSEDENIENYKKFGNAFQWIEPLLVANYFSPDPKSLGDYGVRTEGSFRLVSTSTGWGAPGSSYPDGISAQKGMYKYDGVYVGGDGNVKGLLSTAGVPSSKIPWMKSVKSSAQTNLNIGLQDGILPRNANEGRDRGIDYIQDVVMTDNAKSDIMTRWRRGQHGGEGDGQGLTNQHPQRIGSSVELRIFDNFPADDIQNLLRLLIYLANNTKRSPSNSIHTNESDKYNIWNTATKKVMEEGWNTYLPISYVRLLREELNIPINTRSRRASDIFKQVSKELFDENKNGEWSKLFIQETYTQPPKPKNYNMLAWDYHFRVKLRTSSSVFAKTKSLLHKMYTKFHNDNRLSTGSTGFKGLVESELGKAWSKEDTRDLMDFFGRHGLIRVQYLPNGTVDYIYPTYIEGTLAYKKAQLTENLNNIKNNKSYFEKTTLNIIDAVVEEVAEIIPEVPTISPTSPIIEPEVATQEAFVTEVTQQVAPPRARQQFGQAVSGLPLISNSELRRIRTMVSKCREANTTNGVLNNVGFKNCIAEKRTGLKLYGNLSWKVREAIVNVQYPASKRTFMTFSIRAGTLRSIRNTPDIWRILTVDQLRSNSRRTINQIIGTDDQVLRITASEVLNITYLQPDIRIGSNEIFFLRDRGVDIKNDVNANIIEGVRVRLSNKGIDGYGKGWHSNHPKQSNYEQVKERKRHVEAGIKGAKRKRKYK